MQFDTIVLFYMITGIVMFGGGAVDLNDAGVANFFVTTENGELAPSGTALTEVNGIGGAVEAVATLAVGSLILIWNLAVGLISYLHWPVTVLLSHNAPPVMVLLLGFTSVAAFYLSVIRLVTVSS